MNLMLADKLESALAALVTTAAGDLAVFTGKHSDTKQIPCVICSAEISEDEEPTGSGNHICRGTVAVKQSAVQNPDGTDTGAASPKSATQTISDAIFSAVQTDTLAEDLTSNGTDLTVFPGSIRFLASESGRDDTGLWIDSLSFSCCACPSDLT